MKPVSILFALALLALAAPAQARTLCTLIADPETRSVLLSEGDCESRVTPASTFKVPLAVMGFDAGVLKSAHDPVLPFRQGYPDWGGAPWQREVSRLHIDSQVRNVFATPRPQTDLFARSGMPP